jgi:hypothetical protein
LLRSFLENAGTAFINLQPKDMGLLKRASF